MNGCRIRRRILFSSMVCTISFCSKAEKLQINRGNDSSRLTLVITRLLRSIFIAKIRCVVRSRQSTTLPKVPRPRIFKYSKSLICYEDRRTSKISAILPADRRTYGSSGEHFVHLWILIFRVVRIFVGDHSTVPIPHRCQLLMLQVRCRMPVDQFEGRDPFFARRDQRSDGYE